MNQDPVSVALRHICETRQMLEKLIISSESFDYPRAKEMLKALDRKARELGRLAAKLNAAAPAPPPNVISLPQPVRGGARLDA